jgi:hypothetical protein
MTARKTARWLQVAQRASEFRSLIGRGELAEASQRCEQSEQRWQASEAQSRQAQNAWRLQASKPRFHATDDAQYRRFQAALKEITQRHGLDAQHARQEVAEAQLQLRRNLAEKDALQAAVEQARDRARAQLAQLHKREADEVWAVVQQSKKGWHEDR